MSEVKHTPGPWMTHGQYVITGNDDGQINAHNEADAALIASAPTLLAERDALRAENEQLKVIISSHAEQVFACNEEMERLRGEVARLRTALDRSRIALDDWLHVYTPENCGEPYVSETRKRIKKHGGTVGYIADVQEQNREALAEGEPDGR